METTPQLTNQNILQNKQACNIRMHQVIKIIKGKQLRYKDGDECSY